MPTFKKPSEQFPTESQPFSIYLILLPVLLPQYLPSIIPVRLAYFLLFLKLKKHLTENDFTRRIQNRRIVTE